MRYHPGNVELGTPVYDVEALERLDQVFIVDTGTNEVECAYKPIRFNESGDEVETFKIRFRSIHPIYDRYPPGGKAGEIGMPAMFHCYGRLGSAEAT